MRFLSFVLLGSLLFVATTSQADGLPEHELLRSTLKKVVAEKNGGFGFHMWATVVDRDGKFAGSCVARFIRRGSGDGGGADVEEGTGLIEFGSSSTAKI